MLKKTYKNMAKQCLFVNVKSSDKKFSTTISVAPNKTFEILETQITGDVLIKTKHRLLKETNSEEIPGVTSELSINNMPVVIKPVEQRKPNREVKITTREK